MNGVLFALVALAGSYLVGYWTRRWAAILAVIGVGWVAACTVFLAVVYHRLGR